MNPSSAHILPSQPIPLQSNPDESLLPMDTDLRVLLRSQVSLELSCPATMAQMENVPVPSSGNEQVQCLLPSHYYEASGSWSYANGSPSSQMRGSEGAEMWDADDQGSRTVWKTRAELHCYRRRHSRARSACARPRCCLQSQEATSLCSREPGSLHRAPGHVGLSLSISLFSLPEPADASGAGEGEARRVSTRTCCRANEFCVSCSRCCGVYAKRSAGT